MVFIVAVIQFLSCVWLFKTPWTAARQASVYSTISQTLLKFMSIELVMLSNCLFFYRLHLLLPLIFLGLRIISKEMILCISWPKYWSVSFGISPSSEYSGLISFRVDWFDLFDVLGTHNSLLEYHSSKASILQHSAFFMVWLSHLYMTLEKP